MYLLGNFGTAVKGTEILLTKLPDSLRIGSWVKQGLAFYSGSVCYVKKIRVHFKAGQHVFLQVPHYEGAAVRVLVNGMPAGIIGWEPNELDITNLLKSGDSAILCIEIVSHRRNSHGPFHLKEKRPQWTGPSEFTPDESHFSEAYQLVPCGLMRAPQLVVRRVQK